MDGEERRQHIQEMKLINSGCRISLGNKDLSLKEDMRDLKSLCLFIIQFFLLHLELQNSDF